MWRVAAHEAQRAVLVESGARTGRGGAQRTAQRAREHLGRVRLRVNLGRVRVRARVRARLRARVRARARVGARARLRVRVRVRVRAHRLAHDRITVLARGRDGGEGLAALPVPTHELGQCAERLG